MARAVDVAVPAPLLAPLTYLVPPELESSIKPGVRVRVPLGKRRVVGVVLRESEADDAQREYKSIESLLDPADRPALPDDLLATALWVADYYVAPPGEAVRTALPAALSPTSSDDDEARGAPPTRRLLFAAERVRRDPEAAYLELSKRPAQQRALRAALDSPPASAAELARLSGSTHSAIAALLSAGYLDAKEEPVAAPELPEVEFPVSPPPDLSSAQRSAVNAIGMALEKGEFAPFVLYGVTGAGKTEVYLRAAEFALARGRTTLFLVPEIGLTPGLRHALSSRFGREVVVLHSGLSDRQRYEAWQNARSGATRIVVGARSAVFAPLERPGLIVVDEEHDAGFKQEESPRYHARDLALVRGREAGAVVVLGSATPSLESWGMAKEERATLLTLPERVGGGSLSRVETIDMREEFRATQQDRTLSRRLIEELKRCAALGEQAIVLLNRRGYTRALICRACGLSEQCSACSIAMTWHKQDARLRCHYCGRQRARPERCSHCQSPHLADVGSGTQRAEEELRALVPGLRVARIDRDTVRSARQLAETLSQFARGDLDVLVGTQMVAKGHHFPNVTLVGVVSADASLRLPDFRAAERTFQLLTQVAGRAGRGTRAGLTLIQAFAPDHPAVVSALTQQFEPFAAREMATRELQRYPPAAALGLVLVRDEQQARAFERAAALAEKIAAHGEGQLLLLGPTAAPLARLKEQWRVQILVRARRRRRIVDAIRRAVEETFGKEGAIPGWLVIDIDPHSLM